MWTKSLLALRLISRRLPGRKGRTWTRPFGTRIPLGRAQGTRLPERGGAQEGGMEGRSRTGLGVWETRDQCSPGCFKNRKAV